MQVIPYVYPSPPTSESKLLAIVEGKFNLRVFVEPNENRKDEDLERLEWFEEFAWHETKRKLDFHRWQEEYLRQHPIALRRKTEREQAEAKRRHQEAREKFLKVIKLQGWMRNGFSQIFIYEKQYDSFVFFSKGARDPST